MAQAAGFTKSKGKYVIATITPTGKTSPEKANQTSSRGGPSSTATKSASSSPKSPQERPSGAGRKSHSMTDTRLPKGAMTGSGYKTFNKPNWPSY